VNISSTPLGFVEFWGIYRAKRQCRRHRGGHNPPGRALVGCGLLGPPPVPIFWYICGFDLEKKKNNTFGMRRRCLEAELGQDVATRPQTVQSLCSGVIPGSVMLTPHSTRRIYNRVAITHLLHRVFQKRTYYK